MPRTPPPILFRVAGGPRTGFGHITRALALADALGVEPRLAIRGTDATRTAARRLGASLVSSAAASAPRAIVGCRVVIVDDPSPRAAAASVADARRAARPVVSIHDLGLAPVASDLAIDGSLPSPAIRWPAREVLQGPRFAILPPNLRTHAGMTRRAATPQILISLGGGLRHAHARRIARAIASARPDVRVLLAGGFVREAGQSTHAPLPRNVAVLKTPSRFLRELARSAAAIVGGGRTLYEAAALDVPTLGVAVVPAQRPTVQAFAAHGLSLGAWDLAELTTRGAVRERMAPVLDRRLSGTGRARPRIKPSTVIDGRGAVRVAEAIGRRFLSRRERF